MINQTNKIIWLLETILRARRISFEDINKKWMGNDTLNDGSELPKRTFHRWVEQVYNIFGLEICCEKGNEYRYYISNIRDFKSGSVAEWLLNTYSVSNSLMGCSGLRDRIILENVPSGQRYLQPIIEAMKHSKMVHIDYLTYWSDTISEHFIMPLCVKLFRQRWYVVGRTWPNKRDIIFCLDRIQNFRLSSHSFQYPKSFRPEEFFDACFGVIVMKDVKIEKVDIKVSTQQANYLRDLPMMPGTEQEEIQRTPEYSIFRMRVRPTYDFIQELFWNREQLEVLKPAWLREEMKSIIDKMSEKYK